MRGTERFRKSSNSTYSATSPRQKKVHCQIDSTEMAWNEDARHKLEDAQQRLNKITIRLEGQASFSYLNCPDEQTYRRRAG